MEKENKKLKITANKKIVVFSLIALALLIIGSTSYAYFTAVIEGNDSAKQTSVTTGTMSLKLDGTIDVNMDSAMPGTTVEMPFKVINTGDFNASYAIALTGVQNTFADKSDLVYTIEDKTGKIIKGETIYPSPASVNDIVTLVPVRTIDKGQTHEYVMKVTFLEKNEPQNDNQGKTFAGKIQILPLNNDILAVNILNNNPIIAQTPDFSKGEPPISGTNTGSGLYAAEDDDGTSYYFRGTIENNYVSFANNLWRIVRINGNSSVRMVKEESIGTSAFNTISANHKYVGYTYDNDHICTKANPCTKETGTSSTVKTYLENWYNNNLVMYDNYIAMADYCNDTTTYSSDSNNNYYGGDYRITSNDISPSLKCADTDKTYGGFYKLKIGLLTVDEINMAGIYYDADFNSNETSNFLNKNSANWTMTPMSSTGDTEAVNFTSRDNILDRDDAHYDDLHISPVINLKADTTITSGDGTKTNPYVVG